ncbi:haloacid dehalogenase type II [Aquibacillus koreensis]|uniref:Haloacid dehalogenase type II n=1 Tax=Aquibacillus koreensis TaxID=279446 RepID=A0A9X3WS41_9BACI|nr:haloacid dehalogenase type II [Aquibacillus koreensis]MCT2535265.1 haloacid dehalogenase type II [Aquibacillus koreensis]MDC3422776.1 haloacid dehalogenase type II [Aquibacillus koreensis]
MRTVKAILFDAYGTLFDVQSVTAKLEGFYPGNGANISETWREKQIEYSFLRQLMGNYISFFEVTKDALCYAVEKHGETLRDHQEKSLLQTYLHLSPYPEVKGVLSQLTEQKLAIFSNGSHNMLNPLIENNRMEKSFSKIISVDEIKQYKPTVASYAYATNQLGLKKEEILFVSSNGWDISGAKNYGFNTAWINRKNLPVEKLNLPPDTIYPDLRGIIKWT